MKLVNSLESEGESSETGDSSDESDTAVVIQSECCDTSVVILVHGLEELLLEHHNIC